ncbi:hypothetical protein BGW42_002917 [Actinomortierella wolfii]|nr:hypothetical protein BGW42_002917 [Actinomortierella wolfii]
MKRIDEASASKYSYHKETAKGRDFITPLQSAYKKTEIPDIAALQRSSKQEPVAPLQSAYKKTEVPDIAALQRSAPKPESAPKQQHHRRLQLLHAVVAVVAIVAQASPIPQGAVVAGTKTLTVPSVYLQKRTCDQTCEDTIKDILKSLEITNTDDYRELLLRAKILVESENLDLSDESTKRKLYEELKHILDSELNTVGSPTDGPDDGPDDGADGSKDSGANAP